MRNLIERLFLFCQLIEREIAETDRILPLNPLSRLGG